MSSPDTPPSPSPNRRHASPPARWTGEPSIRGSSELVRMLLLTAVAVGIQFTWRVEMAYCTPYLLELGLSKSGTALVWLAGPFSGMLTQPVVGALSDASTSRWGRRRPFMAAGSVAVAASFLALGFARSIAVAVAAVWCIDLSVNAVMSCARALVADSLPAELQQRGTSWYGRMAATADLLGGSLGAVDLVGLFGTSFGDTQFKQVTVVAACTILVTTSITCWAVSERVLVPPGRRYHHHHNTAAASKVSALLQRLGRAVGRILATMRRLPPRVRTICHAQFLAWLGWFPFLFYSSTWVGELYLRYDAPERGRAEGASGEMGRVGSSALAWYALMVFIGAWLGPLLVKAPPSDGEAALALDLDLNLDINADGDGDGDLGADLNRPRGKRPGPIAGGWLGRRLWWQHRPDLLAAWVAANLGFTTVMVFAPFARSFRAAAIIVAGCGIPWTIHTWAPITFLGVEVNRISISSISTTAAGPNNHLARRGTDDVELEALDAEEDTAEPEPDEQRDPELSGIYFGILNIYVTVPQVIANIVCYVVFVLLGEGSSSSSSSSSSSGGGGGGDGPNAIGVCFFLGAVCTLMAARTTQRLRRLRPDGTIEPS